MPTKVLVKAGEHIDKAITRFKRLVNKDGILKELKLRSRFEKPCARRRRKEKERMKSIHKAQKQQRLRSQGD